MEEELEVIGKTIVDIEVSNLGISLILNDGTRILADKMTAWRSFGMIKARIYMKTQTVERHDRQYKSESELTGRRD